eukprot:8931775-Pyramimonas_sp.AAC.1
MDRSVPGRILRLSFLLSDEAFPSHGPRSLGPALHVVNAPHLKQCTTGSPELSTQATWRLW